MDIGHEQSIIGAIITNPDLLVDIIGKISPGDFENHKAGIIYNGLLEMWAEQKKIDLVTILAHLGDKADMMWVVDSTSIFTSPFMVADYVGLVSESASKRRIKSELANILNEDVDSKKMLSMVANVYDSEGGRETKDSAIVSAMDKFEESIARARVDGFGIDTGFIAFQKNSIQYSPAHIWVMGGFTSVGKTAVLTEMLARLDLKSSRVAVISTEMTTDQMIARYLANKTGFASNVILSGGLYERNQPRLDKAKADLKASNLHIFDDVYEITEIETTLTKLSQQGGVDVVFLDYLQNCVVDGANSEYQEMSALAKRLQKLAKKIRATIVCLSQVSNSSAKDDSGILQFKGAGEFAAVADVGIMLQKSKDVKTQMLLDIRKHRHGKKGKQVMQYTEAWTRLDEIDHADNE